jgi:hypothetical protein
MKKGKTVEQTAAELQTKIEALEAERDRYKLKYEVLQNIVRDFINRVTSYDKTLYSDFFKRLAENEMN